MTLGQRIRERRQALKIGQQQLGERVEVSKQTISRWETDRDTPQGKNMVALARELKIPVETLTAAAPDVAPKVRSQPSEEPEPVSRELAGLRRLIDRTLAPAMLKVSRKRRAEIMQHLVQQVSLLARMAEDSGGDDAAREVK